MKPTLAGFLAAVGYFTRLPTPGWVGHSADDLACAARWLPVIGLLVGLIGALVTELAALALPVGSAILLGMVATVLATGAFHEDGLADACDGFGGGWDKSQVLAIMKDSRVGSYGVIGLGLALLLKWNALVEIDAELEPPGLVIALLAAHAVSRMAALALMQSLDYARGDETDASKSRALTPRASTTDLALAAICALLPCLLLPLAQALTGLLMVVIVALVAAHYFQRRIGGYTGDCLGATQQATEIAFYLGLLCSFT
jgi:adenosylcobinamide-GDP ribazoletransferase